MVDNQPEVVKITISSGEDPTGMARALNCLSLIL